MLMVSKRIAIKSEFFWVILDTYVTEVKSTARCSSIYFGREFFSTRKIRHVFFSVTNRAACHF